MSRRDTIIVAVLLNTGLLAALFMMAINTDEDTVTAPSEIQQLANKAPEPPKSELPPEVIAVAQLPSSATSGDELDNVLKDYAANVPPQTIVLDDDNADTIEKESAALPESKNNEVFAPDKFSNDKLVDVTVKKGDSLDKIARSNGTTIDAIKKASNLKNDKLKVGQIIKVPVGTKKPGEAIKAVIVKKDETKPTANGEPEYYTIKNGDNPWKIAKQFKVKFDDLLKLNNLDEEKARNLKIGDRIRVK